MEIGKQATRVRIKAWAEEMYRRDARACRESSTNDWQCLEADLVEILEGHTADQIVREVGEMSSKQWHDLLIMDLIHLVENSEKIDQRLARMSSFACELIDGIFHDGRDVKELQKTYNKIMKGGKYP